MPERELPTTESGWWALMGHTVRIKVSGRTSHASIVQPLTATKPIRFRGRLYPAGLLVQLRVGTGVRAMYVYRLPEEIQLLS